MKSEIVKSRQERKRIKSEYKTVYKERSESRWEKNEVDIKNAL